MRKGDKINVPRSNEQRLKLSQAMMGNKNQEDKRSGETKALISKAMQGNQNTLGKVYGEETRTKDRIAKTGETNPAWQGGISFLPYTPEWSMKIKQVILERDDNTCQLCGRKPPVIKLHIHHIDYKKGNCETDNLICLCHSCHSKTNHHRGQWGFINGQLQRIQSNA